MHRPYIDNDFTMDYNSYNYPYRCNIIMKTVQMTLDNNLVEMVDRVVKELKTTRSAFTRSALQKAINDHHVRTLEKKHRKGYETQPVKKEEFSAWEHEQDWGDE